MKRQNNNPNRTLDNRQSLHPTLLAGCLTAGLFLALPYVHVVDSQQKLELELMSIEKTDWNVPAPLPLPKQQLQDPKINPLPKPQLTPPKPHVVPLKAMLDFDIDLAEVGGDFDLNFSVLPTPAVFDGATIFSLSEIDQLPQPLVQLRPFYPTHARMRQIEGSVVVEFVVSDSGLTEQIHVISSDPGNTFDTAAIKAVERWRFSPGMVDGKPVAVRVRQTIRFQLEERR